MQYAQIDHNGVYQALVDGIPGDVEGSFFSPEGVRVSTNGPPPTDEPGEWRDMGEEWKRLTTLDKMLLVEAKYEPKFEEQLQILSVASALNDDAKLEAGRKTYSDLLTAMKTEMDSLMGGAQ